MTAGRKPYSRLIVLPVFHPPNAPSACRFRAGLASCYTCRRRASQAAGTHGCLAAGFFCHAQIMPHSCPFLPRHGPNPDEMTRQSGQHERSAKTCKAKRKPHASASRPSRQNIAHRRARPSARQSDRSNRCRSGADRSRAGGVGSGISGPGPPPLKRRHFYTLGKLNANCQRLLASSCEIYDIAERNGQGEGLRQKIRHSVFGKRPAV